MTTQIQQLHNLFSRHRWLTDGGLETVLVFERQVDLPCFAAFDILSRDWGEDVLRDYYQHYLDLAAQHGTGFVLETPTWRASPDWGARLGYSLRELGEANRKSVAVMERIRAANRHVNPLLLSGNIGPRGDGYVASHRMSADEAVDYHGWQVSTFAEAGVDLVSALTLNYSDEALGVARAAQAAAVPAVLSFTLETDGKLPSGESLGDAIQRVDAETGAYPLHYMINCAHPTHFEHTLSGAGEWRKRIRGLRGNASRLSHAELDQATELDGGSPRELAQDYRRIREYLPELRVLGGCCGTDHRHVSEIAAACL